MLTIIDFQPQHQPYFDKFNREWIEEFFEMEPVDEWVLANPGKAIIDTGGAILIGKNSQWACPWASSTQRK